MKHLRLVSVVFLGLLLACVSTGPGGKKSLILIPTSQEVAIGAGMAEQVASTEKTLPDSAWQSYLNEVGQRVVAVCDRKDLDYHFTVIESDQVNAFAAPGGFVYFYTGLLRQMETESEMAAVMAHEISHVVARHGIKRLQVAMGASLAYELAFGDSTSAVLETAIGIGMGLALAGYSRDAEREADNFGMIYLARAGYDPNGMTTMLEKLASLEPGGSENIFEQLARSHPETQERISNAKAELQEIGPVSADARVGRDRYQRMLTRLPGSGS